MDFTAYYLPTQWEVAWRREKERRKRVMQEGGERAVEEHRRMQWIRAYNDRKMALKKKEREEKEETEAKDKTENMENDQAKEEKDPEKEKEKLETTDCKQHLYPTEVFKALEALRQFSVLTDLTFSVDGGHCLRVHSLVLAAVSTTFAYTGTIDCLNRDSLVQVRAAALSLGIPRVEERKKVEERKMVEEQKKVEERKKKLSAEEQMEVSLWSIQKLWAEGVGCDVELEAEGHAFNGKEMWNLLAKVKLKLHVKRFP
uniref:BTB domain-containing protein n=1 Tax=Astyanax mexicanus TaxID=7994 RepID=A0A8B9JDQ9_ASTMX